MNLGEVLAAKGFISPDTLIKDYEKPEDVRLPFVTVDIESNVDRQLLRDMNFIRKNAVGLDPVKFESSTSIYNGQRIKDWILKNYKRCKLVTDGHYHLKEGLRRSSDFEDRWDNDTDFGFYCLEFRIIYSKYSRSFKLDITNEYRFLRRIGLSYLTESFVRPYAKETQIEILDSVIDECEFIPIEIEDTITVYSNRYDESSRRISLGINILEDPTAMEKLEEWIKNGGKINPRVWYYLNESKDGKWYLKRDLEESPRQSKKMNLF